MNPPVPMHDGQIPTSPALVRRLLQTQCPELADLPIVSFASPGTENAIYRVGDAWAVRMPLTVGKSERTQKEHRWLPTFAQRLPLTLPNMLALGQPEHGYPCPWTLLSWLPGQEARLDRLSDPVDAAIALAHFIRALQRVDPVGGPRPGSHNFYRGNALVERDEATRRAAAQSTELVDTDAVLKAWTADLHAPTWDQQPVWIHGDLKASNILVEEGRLSAVIDWGGLGVGDPACEMLPAWDLFEGESRRAFREAVGVDDATWRRGRGFALHAGMVALPYYLKSNPAMAQWARHMIHGVLADHQLL